MLHPIVYLGKRFGPVPVVRFVTSAIFAYSIYQRGGKDTSGLLWFVGFFVVSYIILHFAAIILIIAQSIWMTLRGEAVKAGDLKADDEYQLVLLYVTIAVLTLVRIYSQADVGPGVDWTYWGE